VTDADDKVARMVAQMYREEILFDTNPLDYQLHLASCKTMEAQNAERSDGSYGCDTGCEYMELEATIKCDCPAIADDPWSYGSFGDTSTLLANLIEMDAGLRDNLDHWKSFVFKDPTNVQLLKNMRRIEAMKS